MSDRVTVLETLRNPVARRINFSFVAGNGMRITVNQTTFERVAAAIERGGGVRGGIGLIVRTTMPDPNAGAMYFPQEDRTINPPIPANTIIVNPINGPRQQGQLIHEAVHASFDLTLTRLPAVDNEAAAYIAIALYWQILGVRPRNSNHPLVVDSFAAAASITRTGQVDTAVLTMLKNTISSLPSLNGAGMKICFLSDG